MDAQTPAPEKRQSVLLRMDPEAARQIGIAAARSSKSVNQWASDVLSAAADAANLLATADQLLERGMDHAELRREAALRFGALFDQVGAPGLSEHVREREGTIEKTLHFSGGDEVDVIKKTIGALESMLQAAEIRKTKTRG